GSEPQGRLVLSHCFDIELPCPPRVVEFSLKKAGLYRQGAGESHTGAEVVRGAFDARAFRGDVGRHRLLEFQYSRTDVRRLGTAAHHERAEAQGEPCWPDLSHLCVTSRTERMGWIPAQPDDLVHPQYSDPAPFPVHSKRQGPVYRWQDEIIGRS